MPINLEASAMHDHHHVANRVLDGHTADDGDEDGESKPQQHGGVNDRR
jgi:hypothetical protein